MIDRSYLLKYLQAQDRILLYGKGKNVQLNYQYLKGQTQFSVVGIVTPAAGQTVDPAVPLYEPYQLNTIPASSYDKIVITVRDQALGVEMYQAIRDAGVDEKKIVAAHIYLGPATGISLRDFIESPVQLQQEIRQFIDRKYGNLHYFDPLIKQLTARATERDELCQRFRETARQLSPVENVVFLYILYCGGIFNAQLMKCLAESALQIDQPELLHFLHGIYDDETSMAFLHEEYLFPEYYILRRAFVKKLCNEYNLHIDAGKIRKSAGGKIQRICILLDTLMSRKHAPTLLSIQLSSILAELGYEVKVMPLDASSNISWDFPIFSPMFRLAYYGSREFEEYHREAFHPNVTIEYTDIADPREKMQSELDKLVAFSPDLIIDMEPEVSIASYIYSQYFRTLCFPSGGCQSSSYFTYFSVLDRDIFTAANEVFHSVDCRKAIKHPFFHIIPKARAKYERETYPLAPLDKNDFVLISVGNRIGAELTADFIDIVCEKLLAKQNVKWLIAGGTNAYLSQRYQDLLERHKIVYIPYEDDLPALYQICDVFLSPRRAGGGTSVFWAMYYGLPIAQAASLQADAFIVLGAENVIGETDEQVAEYVLDLWEHPPKYAEESNKVRMRARRVAATQTQRWKEFIDELEIAGLQRAGTEQEELGPVF